MGGPKAPWQGRHLGGDAGARPVGLVLLRGGKVRGTSACMGLSRQVILWRRSGGGVHGKRWGWEGGTWHSHCEGRLAGQSRLRQIQVGGC